MGNIKVSEAITEIAKSTGRSVEDSIKYFFEQYLDGVFEEVTGINPTTGHREKLPAGLSQQHDFSFDPKINACCKRTLVADESAERDPGGYNPDRKVWEIKWSGKYVALPYWTNLRVEKGDVVQLWSKSSARALKGRPPKIMIRVKNQMLADLREGKITLDALSNDKQETLASNYGCNRETMNKARNMAKSEYQSNKKIVGIN